MKYDIILILILYTFLGVKFMTTYSFSAFDVCYEIVLPIIAKHFNVTKKFKWEEPLVLTGNQLKEIVTDIEGKSVYVYSFGSIVFVNFEYHQCMDCIKYLRNAGMEKCFKNMSNFTNTENMKLQVEEGHDMEVNFNSITVGTLKEYHIHTLALMLARSISLEKIEIDIDSLFDEVEKIMDYLDKGILKIKDEKLGKISSKILRIKFDVVSNLGLLDKPDIAWYYEGAEDLYEQLNELFEIKDRFERIKNKTEILSNVMEVFSSLMHSKRGTILEWIVIILIAFEIAAPILGKFLSKLF